MTEATQHTCTFSYYLLFRFGQCSLPKSCHMLTFSVHQHIYIVTLLTEASLQTVISHENAIDPTLIVRHMLSDYRKYLGLCKGNCTFGKKLVMSCWYSTLSRIKKRFFFQTSQRRLSVFYFQQIKMNKSRSIAEYLIYAKICAKNTHFTN